MTRTTRHTLTIVGVLSCAVSVAPVAGAPETVAGDSVEALRVYLDCRFCLGGIGPARGAGAGAELRRDG